MVANYRESITTLWIVFLLGTLFHTQLGLMPLFHGLSIVESTGAQSYADISWIMWLMLGFFAVPMLAIIRLLFNDSKRDRQIHFGITVCYSVMNFLHIVADLVVTPIAWYQIALMVLLFIVGLLLNRVALQGMQKQTHSKPLGIIK